MRLSRSAGQQDLSSGLFQIRGIELLRKAVESAVRGQYHIMTQLYAPPTGPSPGRMKKRCARRQLIKDGEGLAGLESVYLLRLTRQYFS